MPRWLRKNEFGCCVGSFNNPHSWKGRRDRKIFKAGEAHGESLIITPFNFLSFNFQVFLIDNTSVFLGF